MGEPAAVVELSQPVRVFKEDRERLEFRKAKAKDLRVFDGSEGDIDAMLKLIAKLSNVPVGSIDDLCTEDLVRCQEVCEELLGPLMRLGRTSGSSDD